MIFASHAKGRGFNPLTAHTRQNDSYLIHEERAFALIHGHLLNFTPFLELSGLDGVFFCPVSFPPDRAFPTPVQVIDQACAGVLYGDDL